MVGVGGGGGDDYDWFAGVARSEKIRDKYAGLKRGWDMSRTREGRDVLHSGRVMFPTFKGPRHRRRPQGASAPMTSCLGPAWPRLVCRRRGCGGDFSSTPIPATYPRRPFVDPGAAAVATFRRPFVDPHPAHRTREKDKAQDVEHKKRKLAGLLPFLGAATRQDPPAQYLLLHTQPLIYTSHLLLQTSYSTSYPNLLLHTTSYPNLLLHTSHISHRTICSHVGSI